MTIVLNFVAAAPPLNEQATQASASAPVEASWSPPSGGMAGITGYRIFYGNGENVSVPSIITGIILTLSEHLIGQTVSIHSVADHLSSELITATITSPQYERTSCTVIHTTPLRLEDNKSSCITEIGTTVGVIVLLVCFVAMAMTLILATCWWR